MQKKLFCGVGTALVTPFNKEQQIDTETLSALVEYQINGGVDYLVVLGSTAESATLSTAERRMVMDTVLSINAGRLPLVLGIGGNNTAEVAHTLRTTKLDGFEAVLSVCPYYNKPSQRGLELHFQTLADASPLPLILYNVPGRTGVNILPETVVRLAQSRENIIGIKEASGNIEQIQHLAQLVARSDILPTRDFAIISGDDALTPKLLKTRDVRGVISVLSNALPGYWSETIHTIAQDNNYHYYGRFDQLTDMLFREGNPAGIKALLNIMGLAENIVRLPLTTISEELYALMRTEMKKQGLI